MKRVWWVGWVVLALAGCGVSKDRYLKAVSRAQNLEAKLAEREAGLEEARARIRDLEAALARAQRELEAARRAEAEARTQAARAADESAGCREDLSAVSAELDVCVKAKRALEARAGKERNELKEALEQERLGRARERMDWQARLEACRSEVADLKVRLDVLEEEKARAEQEKRERLEEISKTYEGLLNGLQQEVEEGRITIRRLKGKLSVQVLDEILFDSGSAEIKPEGQEVLRRVGRILKQQRDKGIVIEGHTDNVPISGALAERFPTNWELSTARATSVVRFLQDEVGIAPERLSAVGYGPYRPVAPNDTPEGRAKNRRIEIKLVPLEAPLFRPPPPAKEGGPVRKPQ